MSLQTALKVYSKENDLLAQGMVNVVRYVDVQPLFHEIRKCLLQINKCTSTNKFYKKYHPKWKENLAFIEVYGLRIPGDLIRKICSKMTLEKFDECVKELAVLLQ